MISKVTKKGTATHEPQSSTPPATSWWCDVAGKGCLRPVDGQYPAAHKCWAYKAEYMVCESCYKSHKSQTTSDFLLVALSSCLTDCA